MSDLNRNQPVQAKTRIFLLLCAVVIISGFLVRISLAQESVATNTPSEIATTTGEVIVDAAADYIGTSPDLFVNNIDDQTASSSRVVSTSTPGAIEAKARVDAIDLDIQSVTAMQDAYFLQYSKYLQILDGGQVPEYESADSLQSLKGTVPAHITVNVYESPKGKGFQVVYKDDGIEKAVGYGPDAVTLTYTYQKPTADISIATSTATSTEEILTATSTEIAASTTTVTDAATSTDQSTGTDLPSGSDVGTTTPAIDKKTEDVVGDTVPEDFPDPLPEPEPVQEVVSA